MHLVISGLFFLAIAVVLFVTVNPEVASNFDLSDILSLTVISVLLVVIAAALKSKKKSTSSRSSRNYVTISQIFSENVDVSGFEESVQHDFRTPLTSLQGAVEILKSSRLDESQAACIEIIQNATGELRAVIGKILSLQLDKNGADATGLKMDEREKFIVASMSRESRSLADSGIKIILAEDSKVNLAVMETMLKQLGCQNLRTASNGQEVLKLFGELPADLVIMDCQMPVMDGYEATARIRAMNGGNKVSIFALTASVSEQERQKALAAGMDDFYAKPVNRATLTYMLSQATFGSRSDKLKITSLVPAP